MICEPGRGGLYTTRVGVGSAGDASICPCVLVAAGGDGVDVGIDDPNDDASLPVDSLEEASGVDNRVFVMPQASEVKVSGRPSSEVASDVTSAGAELLVCYQHSVQEFGG